MPFAENFNELGDLAELGKRNGVSQISVLRFVPQGRGQLFQQHGLNRLQNLQLKKHRTSSSSWIYGSHRIAVQFSSLEQSTTMLLWDRQADCWT